MSNSSWTIANDAKSNWYFVWRRPSDNLAAFHDAYIRLSFIHAHAKHSPPLSRGLGVAYVPITKCLSRRSVTCLLTDALLSDAFEVHDSLVVFTKDDGM